MTDQHEAQNARQRWDRQSRKNANHAYPLKL
jgi:hypothetical protein